MKKARIVMADEHLVLLEGLSSMFSEKYEVLASVQTGPDLAQAARRHMPDAIVSELGLPGMSGIDVAGMLQQEQNPARMIFLSACADIDVVVRAFRAGAAGYVLKQSPFDELEKALDEALAGRMYITPRIARDLLDAALSAAAAPEQSRFPLLTKRQIEVLRLVARGKTMKEVASTLGISTRTAEAHKYQMMDHLKVRTVPELIQQGIVLGVVEVPQRQLYVPMLAAS